MARLLHVFQKNAGPVPAHVVLYLVLMLLVLVFKRGVIAISVYDQTRGGLVAGFAARDQFQQTPAGLVQAHLAHTSGVVPSMRPALVQNEGLWHQKVVRDGHLLYIGLGASLPQKGCCLTTPIHIFLRSLIVALRVLLPKIAILVPLPTNLEAFLAPQVMQKELILRLELISTLSNLLLLLLLLPSPERRVDNVAADPLGLHLAKVRALGVVRHVTDLPKRSSIH